MTRENRLRHARAYPFAIPAASFLFVDGAARHLRPGETFAEHHYADRVPVIACGSNRSPARLAEKFPDGGDVPVERAWLRDFDVVFSAHITGYGSVPATLAPSPGTRVEVSITWLDAAQLAVMHASETRGENYDYVKLARLDLTLEGDGRWHRALAEAYAYQSRRGALSVDDGPVALGAVRAEGRIFPVMSQDEILAAVHAKVGGTEPVDDFVEQNVIHAHHRRARIMELEADANPFDWPHAAVIGV